VTEEGKVTDGMLALYKNLSEGGVGMIITGLMAVMPEGKLAHKQACIVGLVHENVGHLGIFVSAKVARKEHSQIVKALDHIHALLPGLYRMKITEVKGKGGGVEYEAEFEETRLEDLRLLPRHGRLDEMAFEAVEKVSTLNEKAYSLLVRPLIRPWINEPQAELGRGFHPLRWQRWALSDMNPFIWPLAATASAVKNARKPVEPENPFLMMEKAASGAIAAALDLCRVVRDLNSEALFSQIYSSMIELGIVEPKVYAEMTKKVDPRELPLVRDAIASMEKGGYPQAAARIVALLASLSCPIPLLRLQLADEFVRSDDALSRLSEEELRRVKSEQEVIVSLEPQQALATLPALLGRPEELSRILEVIDKIEKLAAERPELEATEEETRMLQRIKRVLGTASFSEDSALAVHPSPA